MFSIPTVMNSSDITAYSDEGAEVKKTFHSKGKTMLKAIAKLLELSDFDLRSNMGGIAVSGEITLHADNIYIQLCESCGSGVGILFRSCKSKNDYCGGTNHFIRINQLKTDSDKERFIATCKKLMNQYQ